MIADFYLDEGSACQKPESIKKKKKGRLIYEWQTFICDLLTRWNSLAVKKRKKKATATLFAASATSSRRKMNDTEAHLSSSIFWKIFCEDLL